MTFASESDVAANRAGHLSDAQRQRFRRALVTSARPGVLFCVLGLVIGGVLLMRGEDLAPQVFFIGVFGVILIVNALRSRDVARDIDEGILKTKTVKLGPMSDAFLRAQRHWITVDGEKIHFGIISRGAEREWFARGGTFRLHYLPRSRRLVLYEHL